MSLRLPLLLLLLVPIPSSAQTPTPAALAERLDAAARAEIDRQQLVGTAVVAIVGREIAWSKGYGHADRERDIAVDPAATQFRWASLSKPVTAVAALQLAERGKLDLDADVRSYVPEFPDKGAKITPRLLLCHQGGIVHYANGEVKRTERTYDAPHPFADVVVALDAFKESALVHPPGARYAYSTHGYILLSAVVQRAGGEPFAEQVRDRIARPLGMADFRPDYAWEDIPGRAAGYRRAGEAIERRPDDEDHDVSWKLGGGGFTSPAVDLARFGVGLLRRRLVSEETERLMWTPNRPADPEGAKPYGYGFFIIPGPGGSTWVGHDGSQEKARTCLMLDPAAGRGVAVMCNSEWADAVKLAMLLLGEIR